MQRLAQCPVNFNWACEGTNQELRVDISFKSASLLSGEGIPSGSKKKKAIVCCFHDYPLQKPISCLKVLKESCRKINNIDYQPTVLFFVEVNNGAGWGCRKAEVAPSPISAICLGKC